MEQVELMLVRGIAAGCWIGDRSAVQIMTLRPRQRRRGSYRLVTAVVAAMGLIAVLGHLAGQGGPPPATDAERQCRRGALTGEVRHVRDGDTIVVAGVPIRLSGVATPETNGPGGSEVTAAIRRLVLGRELRCELDGGHTHDRCAGIPLSPLHHALAGQICGAMWLPPPSFVETASEGDVPSL